jgi:hypothetical protein
MVPIFGDETPSGPKLEGQVVELFSLINAGIIEEKASKRPFFFNMSDAPGIEVGTLVSFISGENETATSIAVIEKQ